MASTDDLIKEFGFKAAQLGLTIDCPGSGNMLSDTAIVAEAPGEQEVRMKMPLVGGSGTLLWKVLSRYNIHRTNVYVTNVSKRQVLISAANDERVPIPLQELALWKGLLLWELKQLPNLKYILVLGALAHKVLSPYMIDEEGNKIQVISGITTWRGTTSWLNVEGNEYQATYAYNPAHVRRNPINEVTFRLDIHKFVRVVNGQYKPYKIKHHYDPSFNEALRWLDEAQSCDVPIGFDIETMSGETACYGLAWKDHEGYCINLRTQNANRFSAREERILLRRIQRLVSDPNVKLVMQNGIFDCSWMWFKDKIRVRRVWFDTLLAHHTMYSQLPHNLGFLVAQYTEHPFYKDDSKTWQESGDISKEWIYNVKDAVLTRYIANRLLTELRSQGLDKFFFEHVMTLQPHLVTMIVGGVRADAELKDHIAIALKHQVHELLIEFHQAVHAATGDMEYNPNPLSPVQLRELFFRRLKLVGRGVSTDQDNRTRIRNNWETPPLAVEMISVLDKYKYAETFHSRYASSKLDEDGRFRCEYKQHGTQRAPGRLSSSSTPWGTGQNLQNQPERARSMFIADDGFVFLYFDLAQAEARFVGWDAQIHAWIEQFEKARLEPGSYDCHRAMASQMFNVPYDDVPKKDYDPETGKHTIRYIGKRCRHAMNYGLRPSGLSTQLGCSMERARQLFNIYHDITPELANHDGWWNTLERMARCDKVLYNAYGRPLRLLGRIDEHSLDSIIAYRPQSSIGDKVNRVIYMSQEDRRWPTNRARIVLTIHDALVAMAKPADAMRCLSIMKKYAQEPLEWPSAANGEIVSMIIPADCKITKTKTSWRIDDDGEIEFYSDEQGFYRWSDMASVDVEAAP